MTQVIVFDNFGALESHLQGLLDHYKGSAAKYREFLGEVMRSNAGEDSKWSQEMSAALVGGEPKKTKDKPKTKTKAFGGSKKEKAESVQGGWVSFDQLSVFTGQGAAGTAELYFEAINHLDDTARRLQLSIDILGTLRSRLAAPGSISLVVSFIDDVPSKMILKPAPPNVKKKSWAFSFSVPVVQPALQQLVAPREAPTKVQRRGS